MSDEIIQEVWHSKDKIAKKFDYDISKLAAELQRQQQQLVRKAINLAEESTRQAAEHNK